MAKSSSNQKAPNGGATVSPERMTRTKQNAILLGVLMGAPLGWLLKFGDTKYMGMFICGMIGLHLAQVFLPNALDDEKDDLTFTDWLSRVVVFRVVPAGVATLPAFLFEGVKRGSDGKLFLAVALGALFGGSFAAVVAPLLHTASPKRLIRPFGLTAFGFFLFLWFMPVSFVGGVKKSVPGYPPFIQNLYRISCLFTHSSSNWKTAHYQVRFEGSDKWVEGFEPGFFDQSIFGYRTRFNRILGQSINRGCKGQARQRKMAEYISERWAEMYPGDPKVVGVRYLRVPHRVAESHCMANERWRKLPLATYPQDNWRIEATHDLTKPHRCKPKKKKKKKKARSKKTRSSTSAKRKGSSTTQPMSGAAGGPRLKPILGPKTLLQKPGAPTQQRTGGQP